MYTPCEKSTPRLPLLCKIIYALAAASALLYFAFTRLPDFADWFNRTVSPVGRAFLGILTAWIPFSFAEWMLILSPLWIVLLCVRGYRRYCGTWRGFFVYVGILFSAVCVVLILFVWNFSAGYYGHTLDQKLSLDRKPVSAEELYDTAEILANEIRRVESEITFLPSGDSLMPYSVFEMNEKLLTAYDRLAEKYDFIDRFPSTVKPVLLSEPMSYTHITGVYTFFTGEANVNVNFPDYTIPYTAAHELAHQRGIAREDEANFVAFLVCMESDDPYIRYSGYLNTYEYVASALSSANRELYKKSYLALPKTVHAEETAYRLFFEKYKENVAASVSQSVNNSYLQSQGAVAGTKSYNMVVDLAVAFFQAAKP
jgi:hypothetical protein